MTDVIVVGEDDVTQAIAEKLIAYANPRLSIDRRRNPTNIEPGFDQKPSLFLMVNLASMSPDEGLREMLTPRKRAKKGPGYNGALGPFIRNHWNIEAAARNSYSLTKAIRRISEFRWP